MKERNTLGPIRTIILLLNYFAGYEFVYPYIFSEVLYGITGRYNIIMINALIYGWTFIVTVIIAWPLIRYGWKKFWISFPQNARRIVLSMVCLYGFTILATMVVYQITGVPVSRNQMEINWYFRRQPLYVVMIACIFAPLVEECVFRGALQGWLKSKGLAILGIVISSVLFGFMHVAGEIFAGNMEELIYILPYAGMGLVFGILYHKSDSVFCSMMLHLLNNAISMLLLVIWK